MKTIFEFEDDQPEIPAYAVVTQLETVDSAALESIIHSNTRPKLALRELTPDTVDKILPYAVRQYVEDALKKAHHRALVSVILRGELCAFQVFYRNEKGRTAGVNAAAMDHPPANIIGTSGQRLLKKVYDALLTADDSAEIVTVLE